MIEVHGLTKRYGATTAVDDLTFTVQPGMVTGFLGPNGAGKSTTMRMMLGLDRPTSGTALIGGRPYSKSPAPLHEVGALLSAGDVHGGRTARAHLHALALSHGLPRSRVDDVLMLTGLTDVAGRRIKGFSLGMSQRLGIAAAMLGDPGTVLFDEPVNGLDPEGIRWIRGFLRGLAAEGRTVLVSSHLMSEMAQTADHLVVIGRGKLIADTSVTEFVDRNSTQAVRVRSPQADRLAELLRHEGHGVTRSDGYLDVAGVTTEQVGDLAAGASITLHELFTLRSSLEEVFMELTADSVEYSGGGQAVA